MTSSGNHRMILVTGLATLSGCSPTEQKIDRNNQTVESWQATAQFTKQLRDRGALPEQYVRQVIDAATRELERARRSSEKTRK